MVGDSFFLFLFNYFLFFIFLNIRVYFRFFFEMHKSLLQILSCMTQFARQFPKDCRASHFAAAKIVLAAAVRVIITVGITVFLFFLLKSYEVILLHLPILLWYWFWKWFIFSGAHKKIYNLRRTSIRNSAYIISKQEDFTGNWSHSSCSNVHK